MSKNISKTNNIKPFRLFKYFAFAGFVVVALSTILLSLFLFHQEKSTLLRKNESFAVLLSENLNHQIFIKYVLPTLRQFGKITLRQEQEYDRLDKVVKSNLYGFNVDSVTLYSHDRLMVYSTKYTLEEMLKISTQPEYLGSKTAQNPLLDNALGGHASSKIISEGSFFELYFEVSPHLQKMSTMAPFRTDLKVDTKIEPIMGALEIVIDVTKDFRDILKQQFVSISAIVLIMLFLFLTLLFIVRRAEQILEKRQKEKERLEQQLNQAERLAGLGRMVAGVSHEIRNPLGIISSTAEILSKRMKEYEPGNRLADIISEESMRMNGVLTEFLDFARPQVPNPEPCMLKDIVERNLEYNELQFEKMGIEVRSEIPSDLRRINADSNLIYRCLLNVFNNAIQAMPDGGGIEVTVKEIKRDGRHAQQITVNDTGLGIPEEARENLFTPFFTTREKGTGLGLAIVKNIIEGHGGHILIESPIFRDPKGHGFGTSVSIILNFDPHLQEKL